MKSPGKYIIIVCDEPQRMEAARQVFEASDTRVGVALAGNARDLTSLLIEKTPDLIVVHLVSGGERYIRYLKHFRKDMAIDHVPVLVYNSPPDRADIQRILRFVGDGPDQV